MSSVSSLDAEYWLLSLVQVDRGMIQTGKRADGTPIMGKHIPYYAGLVIQHKETGKRYFLDKFNSEVLLRDFLGYTGTSMYDVCGLSLKEMILRNEFIMLRNNINLVIVKDIENFIKMNGIIKKRRNARTMHEIAAEIRTCYFHTTAKEYL